MNINQFNQLADKTRLKPRTRSMAEAVLVDDIPPLQVAKQFNAHHQAVYRACSTVLKVADLEKVTVYVRPRLAKAIKDMARLGFPAV